jgi:hypothetical protein
LLFLINRVKSRSFRYNARNKSMRSFGGDDKMAITLLDVPYVPQLNIGGHVEGYVGHSEQNGCWYASTCMIGYFWEVGPRLGVPAQYAGNPTDPKPMGARYAELAKNENFAPVDLPPDKAWTANRLMEVLGQYGPCYVRRGFRNSLGVLSGGHAIVLIGANNGNDEVAVLDPWKNAKNPTGLRFFPVSEFNSFFKWDDSNASKYSLMYKKQPSVVAARAYILTKRKESWTNYLR